MENEAKGESSLYPLRPSEITQHPDFLVDVEPLSLNDEEREEISKFEEPLFSELRIIKDISVSTHVIYPMAFANEEGSRIFAEIYLGREVENEKTFSEQEIIEGFLAADLASIPVESRKRGNRYSSEWAKGQFTQEFQEAGGNIEGISNPERITSIVDVDKLIGKVKGLRNFKKHLKELSRGLADKDTLTEAKRTALKFYQRYVNVLIAQEYDSGRVLSAYPKRNENEEKALSLLRGTNREAQSDRFSSKQASRTLERIDHFLAGTEVRIGQNRLFETIPERLAEYAQVRATEPPPDETPEYQKFNSYKVDAQQAKILCEAVLRSYGLAEGDKAWSAVVLERKGTLGVSKGKREVRIPESFDRGLVDTLTVLAHEVEGHVLRHKNQEESLGNGLRLTDELATGRGGILSEAAAMRIEDDTKQMMVGQKREALPYYYLTLLAKREGGSFKDCFRTFFEAYAKRKYGLSLDEAVNDKEVYREIFDYTYDRALRVFRRNTSLDDTSGFLPISEQLEYIEQELVVDVLKEKGLTRLLNVAGVDLYSLQELRRLGMLDLSKIEEPRLVVASEIWPKIRRVLDEGKTLEEAVEGLS
ncbi:MAG: hypothetical protein ABIH88_00970 [Patescibacteria group bacterium]